MGSDELARLIDGDGWAEHPEWNGVTRQVIGAAIEVHTALGPGLPEKMYEDAMMVELPLRGLRVERQKAVQVQFKGRRLSPMVIDILVNEMVVLELKAIDKVPEVHLAKLVSYLRCARLPLGLLINFNVVRVKDGIFRRANSAAWASVRALGPPEMRVTTIPLS